MILLLLWRSSSYTHVYILARRTWYKHKKSKKGRVSIGMGWHQCFMGQDKLYQALERLVNKMKKDKSEKFFKLKRVCYFLADSDPATTSEQRLLTCCSSGPECCSHSSIWWTHHLQHMSLPHKDFLWEYQLQKLNQVSLLCTSHRAYFFFLNST